ncbi:hypothetical protein FACS189472_08490 [Alphaproteobacteria bacterium]|nr:hypothetical protein FACS189472_08490 [Alphaproteobacteria bacterium]
MTEYGVHIKIETLIFNLKYELEELKEPVKNLESNNGNGNGNSNGDNNDNDCEDCVKIDIPDEPEGEGEEVATNEIYFGEQTFIKTWTGSDFPEEHKIENFFPVNSTLISYGGFVKTQREGVTMVAPLPAAELDMAQVGLDLIFAVPPSEESFPIVMKVWFKYTKSNSPRETNAPTVSTFPPPISPAPPVISEDNESP